MPELKFSEGYAFDEEGRFTILNPEPVSAGVDSLAGEVYLAADGKLGGQKVAVKFLKPSVVFEHSRLIELFDKEIDALSKCSEHPHIVRILGYGIAEDEAEERTFFLVMEYIANAWEYGEKLPLDQVIQIGLQISSALKLIHKNGIIHRDIKPENILLRREKNLVHAKLADFGLVKYFDPKHESQIGPATVMGTRDYACPQQYDQVEAIKPGVDVYSLAKTLYTFATGKIPRYPLQPLSEEDFEEHGALPQKFADLLIKTTALKVSDRYQTAEEFEDALAELRNSLAKGESTIEDNSKDKNEETDSSVELVQITDEIVEVEPGQEILVYEQKSYRGLFLGAILLIIIVSLGFYVVDRDIFNPIQWWQTYQQQRADSKAEEERQKESLITQQLEDWRTAGNWTKIIEWMDENGKPVEEARMNVVGEAMAETGKLEEGMRMMYDAVVVGENAEHWLRYAKCAAKFNQEDRAIAAYQAVLEYDPGNTEAKQLLDSKGVLEP